MVRQPCYIVTQRAPHTSVALEHFVSNANMRSIRRLLHNVLT